MTELRICFIGDSLVLGTGDDEFLGWPGWVGNRKFTFYINVLAVMKMIFNRFSSFY